MSEIIYQDKVGNVTFEIVKDTTGAIWPFNYQAVKRPPTGEPEIRKFRTEDDALAGLMEMM